MQRTRSPGKAPGDESPEPEPQGTRQTLFVEHLNPLGPQERKGPSLRARSLPRPIKCMACPNFEAPDREASVSEVSQTYCSTCGCGDQIFWKAYRLHCATEWHKHSRHVCLHADCRGFYSGALVELLVVASQKLQWFRLLGDLGGARLAGVESRGFYIGS